MPRVACVGAGSWGTTVAALAAYNDVDVVLWARRERLADQINSIHENDEYLPGIKLPPNLVATSDLAEATDGAEVIVMGVPSHGWRDVLRQMTDAVCQADAVVSLTKGLEENTNVRMSQVLFEECPTFDSKKYAILAGPNIAREIAHRLPAAAALACEDEARAERIQEIFHQPYFRVYTHTDVVGSELGGAVKNIVAIAAGIADTMGFGDNAMAALITRGLAELIRLGVKFGADPLTFAGLAGMGDMIVTCSSRYSRNRRVGKELAKGRSIADITSEMKMVAEGVKTCRPILQLGQQVESWMPITEGVVSVIYGGVTPEEMVETMLSRPAVPETHGITN